jgi:hypothetical protein
MRKQHLIKHPPSKSMSERQEVHLLTKQLRKLENAEPTPENINLMLRLSQRIGKLRDGVKRRKNPPVLGRPVGRPKNVKPVEPEAVSDHAKALQAVLEEERQRRLETPEPSIVHEHARRAEVKADIKKEREAVENPPITAPQSYVQEVGDGITPPTQTSFDVVSGIAPSPLDTRSMRVEMLDGFDAYQDAKAREDEQRRRYAEQHPVSREPREEGTLTDSYTGRPVVRDGW